ncbi:hypothetical protein ACH429_13800 [Streptomyces pathocidini]|uniref:Uncharacterized protein n=1 Tax=Streptomyces pathocidini TaxID=1650571 RepID=A0ABW7UTX4_9ACTN|nr:hypothetical protein [Streptomyces pathocidini]
MWKRHVTAYRRSLGLVPEGPFRSFTEWVVRQPGYADRWFQLSALSELDRMVGHLVDGLFDEVERDRLAPYISLMNNHQVFETASDDLAIGLAARTDQDLSRSARRELLVGFNNAMVQRLSGGGPGPARDAVLALQPLARNVSIFQQSLYGGEFHDLVRGFVAAHPEESVEAVEFDVLPILVANIECAATLVDHVSELASAELVRSGLVRRYAAVNRLLTEELTTEELLATGLDAILVIPTLAYCVGVAAETVRPVRTFPKVVGDGRLERALENAALAVRILNDCGTRLVEQPSERAALREQLAALQEKTGGTGTLADLLLHAQEGRRDLLARLRKDLVHGEFNVCLDGLRDLPATRDALCLFGDRLHLIAARYQAATEDLDTQLTEISEEFSDTAPSAMIARFVDFHRVMYARSYEDGTGGDFAVPLLGPGRQERRRPGEPGRGAVQG